METDGMQIFVVQPDRRAYPQSNMKVILWAGGRDDAKRKASRSTLREMGNPDEYIVTPITNPGDRVKLDITLNV